MTTTIDTHSPRVERAQVALTNAHAPVHQSTLPRLVLGLIAIVPAVSLVLALTSSGATQMGFAYLNILWTGLLILVFGGWMVTSRRFSSAQKLAWTFTWVLAAPITLPLYWYRHVLKAPEALVTHD